MKNEKTIFFLLIFLFLFGISTISAYQQNKTIDVAIPTNASNCNITIKSPTSENLVENQIMTINVGFANYTLNSSFVQASGTYEYLSDCGNGKFEVTPNGDSLSLAKGFYLALILLTLGIFMIISLYFFKETDNYLIELANFGIAYLLMTLILFILWQVSENYVIFFSGLSVILKWIFICFAIGFFALFVFMMFKTLKEIYDNREVQKLMNHGMMEDEARARIKSRRKA